jgi:hypothetical protein
MAEDNFLNRVYAKFRFGLKNRPQDSRIRPHFYKKMCMRLRFGLTIRSHDSVSSNFEFEFQLTNI